jgi:DNA-binding transcriptional ArsR family regulator
MSTVNRKEILDLLAGGKISATEAAELLNSATNEESSAEKPWKVEIDAEAEDPATLKEAAPTARKAQGLRWFHVRVRNLETGKSKVTVNIPLPLVKFGLKIGSQFRPELEELSWDDLSRQLEETGQGILVDVQDEESNEHVQVYVD